MAVTQRDGRLEWTRRGRAERIVRLLAWIAGCAIVGQAWRYVSGRTTWTFVADAPQQAADLLGRMVPPDLGYLRQLGRPLLDTIHIATLGTLLAIVLAAPLALLAARTTSPHPLARWGALLAIVSSRSVNSLIWAMILVTIIGPGVLAGIIAVALRSIGFIGKLLYEAVEEIDPRPVEAVSSTGASPAQVLVYGTFPQILPAFAGVSVFRWDINIREATVVGLVGAGGIGLQLDACVSALEWTRASVLLAAVLALCIVSEWVSARIRRAVS